MKVAEKLRLTFKVLPYVVGVMILKLIAKWFNIECLTLSVLYGTIISANVFMVGLLIGGIIGDYKESEKLPGELAANLEIMVDKVVGNEDKKVVYDWQNRIHKLTEDIVDWFYKRSTTRDLLNKMTQIHSKGPKVMVERLESELFAIKRTILRMNTIRETSFNTSIYGIAQVTTILMALSLVLVKFEPFYEGLFFTGFVTFINTYMLFLISDLDNPFGYYLKNNLAADISLQPLVDFRKRFNKIKG